MCVHICIYNCSMVARVASKQKHLCPTRPPIRWHITKSIHPVIDAGEVAVMPGSTPFGKKPRNNQTLKHATKQPLIPADAVLRTPPMLNVEKKHIKHPASPANWAKRPMPMALLLRVTVAHNSMNITP